MISHPMSMITRGALRWWQGSLCGTGRLSSCCLADFFLPQLRHLTSATPPSDRPGSIDDPVAAEANGEGAVEREAPGQNPALSSQQQQDGQQDWQRQRQEQQWQSTVNAKEAEKFAKFSAEWWAEGGPFAPLHRMNPARVHFIRDALCDNYGLDPLLPLPLSSLRVLDIGCGGGILSESLARLGAHVTGIDVNEQAIAAAGEHKQQDPLIKGLLRYRVATAEQLAAEGDLWDAVIASEVIEHVKSLPHFCASLERLTKPGGAVVVTTLNRTPRSLVLAVVAAEYLLRWVPEGTHDWSKFLTPEELTMAVEDSSGGELALEQLAGLTYDPLSRQWSLGTNTAMNYAAYFRKRL